MKKAKLFMMLALLVMGVSNTMGATKTKDFFVNYDKQFLDGAGYTFDASKSDRITKIEYFEKLTATLGDAIKAVGDRMIRVTYNEYTNSDYPTGNQRPYVYSNSTQEDARTGYVNYDLARELLKCISAKNLKTDNNLYNKTVWIRSVATAVKNNWEQTVGYDYSGGNTVYITYQYTGEIKEEDTWTVGNFTFSTIYDKTNSTNVKNKIKLPDGTCAVKLNKYTDTEVTIPLVDPKKKKEVVALQTLAMCEDVEHTIDFNSCDNIESGSHTVSWSSTFKNYSSNGTLTKVTFEKGTTGSNVRSIGDYAFESCYKLTTIEIPKSVEYLGEGCFSQCLGFTDGLTFERTSGASFTTKLEVIRNYTFWNCQNMTSLDLPDNIIVIEGQQSGSSMQYMTSLTHLNLPNTLLAIGPHFLCDASSLPEVTIPASVRYIDGACFHGCQALRKVYLLGPASALQGVYDGSDTFGANPTLCKDNVSNCVFITTQDNIKGYAEDANGVWPLIADNQYGRCNGTNKLPLRAIQVDENGEVIRTASGGFVYETGDKAYLKYKDGTTNVTTTTCSKGWGNALVYLPDQKVTFTPDKWVTVIFPMEFNYDELKANFGTDVMLAKMTGFQTPESSVVNGKLVYHLNFTDVTSGGAKANTPYMIKPGHRTANDNTPYDVILIKANQMNEDYRKEMNKDHALKIDAQDESEVVMYGWYRRIDKMKQWEFYFLNPADEKGQYNNNCQFKRIVDPAQAPAIRPFRCYWRIWLKGEAQDAGAGSKTTFFRFADDNETTGIEQVDSKIDIEFGIYDMNGRKLNLKKEELPKGLFIINGKKIMINK